MNKNTIIEDLYKSIQKADNENSKKDLCLKQIEFFKGQTELNEYNFDEFCLIIEDLEKSKNIELNKIWISLINEIVRLNPSYLEKFSNIILKKIFQSNFSQINDFDEIKIRSISIFTNNCNNLTKNMYINQEILLYLVLECLINNNNLEIINLINNYINYVFNNKLKFPFYFDEMIIIIYCRNIIYDYYNENFEFKSDLLELLNTYIFRFDLINNYVLIYILIVYCLLITENKKELLKGINNLLNKQNNKTIRLLLNFLNFQNKNYIENINKLNILNNINNFFIYDLVKNNQKKYNQIFENFQKKNFDLKEKINKDNSCIIIGAIKLIKYILNENLLNKNNFSSNLILTIYLEGLNNLINLNIEKINNCIIECLNSIIINIGETFFSEWDIIINIITNYIKDKNEMKKNNFELIIFSIIELDLIRKYKGNKETLYNLLNTFKEYDNTNLSIISIVNKLKKKKYFEKNYNEIILEIPNYLQLINNLNNSKNIIIIRYILSFLLVYSIKYTYLIENIIFTKLPLLTSSFFPYSYLLKFWSKIIINILLNTNNNDISQCIITYLFSLVQEEKYNYFTSQIIKKLIPNLSKTNQYNKLDFIFEYLNNYLQNTEKIDTKFFLSIVDILDHSFYTTDNRLIIGKLSNKNSNDLNLIYKYPILNISSITLVKTKLNTAFIDISFIYGYLIMKLNDQNTDSAFKERILLFFSNQISDIFYFKNIELTPLISYIIKLQKSNFDKFLENKLSIKYMINILINSCFNLLKFNDIILIRNSNLIFYQIIEYTIKKIEILSKNTFENIMKEYKLKEPKSKSVVSGISNFLTFKKNSSSLNDLKDNHILIENSLFFLYNYFILLEDYLYFLGCNFEKKNTFNDKDEVGNFSVMEINEDVIPPKYNLLLNKVFEVLIEATKIAQYKEKFILYIFKFFFMTQKFFNLYGEDSIKYVLFILLNLVFPTYSKKWYSDFTSEFHNYYSEEFKKMEFKSKKIKLAQEIQFFGKQLIIYYLSSSEIIFPKIKKIIQKNLIKNNDTQLFLDLCQMNIITNQKNVDEIPNLSNDSNIYLNDKSFIKVYDNKTTIFVSSISEKCLDIKKRNNNLKIENINLLNSLFKINGESINLESQKKERKFNDSILEIKNIFNSNNNSYKLCDKSDLPKFEKYEIKLQSHPLSQIFNVSFTGLIPNKKYITKNDFYSFTKDTFNLNYEKIFLSDIDSSIYKSIDGINTINFKILNENSIEQICIVFVNNIEKKYIHDFFTELLPSDNILIYIVINMLWETHWKIQILYNKNKDKEKIINKIRKKINNNFPEDFIIYIDQDYKYISLYLHKMIIIINIIINRVLDNNYEFKFSIYSDRFNLLKEIRNEI